MWSLEKCGEDKNRYLPTINWISAELSYVTSSGYHCLVWSSSARIYRKVYLRNRYLCSCLYLIFWLKGKRCPSVASVYELVMNSIAQIDWKWPFNPFGTTVTIIWDTGKIPWLHISNHYSKCFSPEIMNIYSATTLVFMFTAYSTNLALRWCNT